MTGVFFFIFIALSLGVTYVAALSLWALVSGHWSAWQAARVEVNQEQQEKAHQAEDLPKEIVERVVEETEVSRTDAARENSLRRR